MEEKGHVTDLLFTLALFCVFAASALLVVLMGANVYKQTAAGMAQNYNTRTSISYLAEKIRQNDVANGIKIESIDGKDALVLEQTVGKSTYQTWIYSSDGMLREVMVAAGTKVEAADGQPIMEIENLQVEQDIPGMISLTATDLDGKVAVLKMALRCSAD
ncbi:uncharacterized protein DUF4860 [Hydrogenoanaerobacterium saccharovorans]|uniref:DUF4860 domain-containing protein n=1 Tax=Hydrogenoanaerobacterium saccharovorans TaxID=474960 RepID=A0A1H8DVP1_9FIRM|nr:DUF4860 domain-containing protein [Hydrogenoanaerobacterium saccharovorans]RPF42416.1 uncharacterized protein DUF4860 [Hydrogenoanaerobacterium saccharovorans]SEN11226.1 protein of unknown function [Hydrogenoanaerobacterium saccharovorans]